LSTTQLPLRIDQEVDDTDKILEGWKDYFSELYSTNNSATFELEKLELVKLQNEILENSEKDGTPIEAVFKDDAF
jgi:hypothetical protein